MLIIIGKTCSGKDTIVKRLVTDHGFKKLITYTTRPIRKGEIRDVTYHYISVDEFLEKVYENFFAEHKQYKVADGSTWFYGCSIEDIKNADDKTVVILTPDGYRDLITKFPITRKSLKTIYVYANNPTIKKRLKKRGDSKDEAERRLKQDNFDFKGIENEVDKIVYNNDNDTIDEIIENIFRYLEK